MFFLAFHVSIKEWWLGVCSLRTFCESCGLYVQHVACMLGCWFKARVASKLEVKLEMFSESTAKGIAGRN